MPIRDYGQEIPVQMKERLGMNLAKKKREDEKLRFAQNMEILEKFGLSGKMKKRLAKQKKGKVIVVDFVQKVVVKKTRTQTKKVVNG